MCMKKPLLEKRLAFESNNCKYSEQNGLPHLMTYPIFRGTRYIVFYHCHLQFQILWMTYHRSRPLEMPTSRLSEELK